MCCENQRFHGPEHYKRASGSQSRERSFHAMDALCRCGHDYPFAADWKVHTRKSEMGAAIVHPSLAHCRILRTGPGAQRHCMHSAVREHRNLRQHPHCLHLRVPAVHDGQLESLGQQHRPHVGLLASGHVGTMDLGRTDGHLRATPVLAGAEQCFWTVNACRLLWRPWHGSSTGSCFPNLQL